MITYHFGKDTKNIKTQKCILISLKSYEKDESLGTLNLVGKDLNFIMDRYPNLSIIKDEVELVTKKFKVNFRIDTQSRKIKSYSLLRHN